MIYGSEFWVMDIKMKPRMSVRDIRMFKWIKGVVIGDSMQN